MYMNHSLANTLGPMAGILGIIYVAVLIGSLVWLYSDAEARGKSGCLLVILILLIAWPLGIVIWLIARPPLTAKPPTDWSASCPRCGQRISAHIACCPSCGAARQVFPR